MKKNISDTINKMLGRKSNDQVVIENLGIEAQETLKNAPTIEEGVEEITEQAVGRIEENPELAKDITKKILDIVKKSKEVELSDVDIKDVAEDILRKVMESEKTSTQEGIKVAEVIPDKAIVNVAGEVSAEQGAKIVEAIVDEDIKDKAEKMILTQKLDDIYNNVEQMNDAEVVGQMSKIELSSKEIEKKKQKIIAKKIASNYKTHGSTLLSHIIMSIPASKMKMIDMEDLVEEEYNKLEISKEDKQYDKQDFSKKLIDEALKEPQKMEEAEMKEFDLIRVMMSNLDPEDRKKILKRTRSQIIDSKKRNVYDKLEESGLIESLSSFRENTAENAIGKMANSIKKRVPEQQKQYYVAETTPNIKKYELNNKDKDDEQEYR